MAKIYETQTDFERDKLREQASDLRLKAAGESSSGLSYAILSWLSESIRASKPETRGWMNYLTGGLIGLGFLQVIRSWFTGSKAHNLDLERERMGPEKIILPPDSNDVGAKIFTASIEPKALMDRADKSCPTCPISKY